MPTSVQNPSSFEQSTKAILEEVQNAYRHLLAEAGCASAQTAAELQRALGLDKKLGWQVFRVIQAPSPMTAGFAIPSKTSTKRLGNAAIKRGANKDSADSLIEVVSRFEQFVKENTAGRAEFESIIADWAPEGRESVELANRREAFNAMSKLRGLACETSFYTVITHPSRDGESIDRVLLHGYLGVRRLSSSAKMLAEYLYTDPSDDEGQERAIDGERINKPESILLKEFCSEPTPTIETQGCGPGQMIYWLRNEEIGARSSTNAVFGLRRTRLMPRYRSDDRPSATHYISPATPTQRVVFDCVVHRDLLTDAEPSVLVHEAAANGPVASRADLIRREPDLLDWRPQIHRIGPGISRMQNRFIPRYNDMLARACDHMGWDPGAFMGYRIEVEYPVHSWQISLVLPKADRPS